MELCSWTASVWYYGSPNQASHHIPQHIVHIAVGQLVLPDRPGQDVVNLTTVYGQVSVHMACGKSIEASSHDLVTPALNQGFQFINVDVVVDCGQCSGWLYLICCKGSELV